MDDRIKHIKELQRNPYKHQKSPSMILNNFFALMTIVVVAISITLYTVYILPAQQEREAKELKEKKKQEYFEQRAKQIALSHKLNDKQNKKENNDAK